MDLHLIINILIAMLFSAFFSGMEIAYVSSNRMLAEMDDDKGVTMRIIRFFYRHPNTFVSTMLVGNNIALVIYGILIARLFDSTIFAGQSEAISVAGDTIISTLIVLFTGEFLPKTIFKNNANGLLAFFALPAMACYVILYPISRMCTGLSRLFLRMMGVSVKKTEEKEEFTKVDLDYLVQQSIDKSSHNDLQEEVRIFQNALDLSDTKVRDCMKPRTEINGVEKEASLEELRQQFVESGHSKVIVYEGDIDHVIGYVHSSELFRMENEKWLEHVRQLPFVPESMAARKLMQNLLAQKVSLAVVVDEFGGTSGIVALEDVVEEIIGEIEDEHDVTNYECRQTKDGGYLLSARLEIERVNEELGIDLPESDDYKTVNGLILARHQSFPKLNEEIQFDSWNCKILKNTKTKIELVKLTKVQDEK